MTDAVTRTDLEICIPPIPPVQAAPPPIHQWSYIWELWNVCDYALISNRILQILEIFQPHCTHSATLNLCLEAHYVHFLVILLASLLFVCLRMMPWHYMGHRGTLFSIDKSKPFSSSTHHMRFSHNPIQRMELGAFNICQGLDSMQGSHFIVIAITSNLSN